MRSEYITRPLLAFIFAREFVTKCVTLHNYCGHLTLFCVPAHSRVDAVRGLTRVGTMSDEKKRLMQTQN